jgi:hypothetical protein
MQDKYLEEFEKYKNIPLSVGLYVQESTGFNYRILEITDEFVQMETVKTGFVRKRTHHWCRKNLVKIEGD